MKHYLTISTLLILAIFTFCNKKEQNQDIQTKMVVLTSIGSVKAGDRELKSGDIVSEGDVISSGEQSLAVLQVIGDTSSTYTIRIQASTTFKLQSQKVNERVYHNANLDQGLMKIHADKGSQDENFSVQTPTTVAAVRGTDFSVSNDARGNSEIQVINGKVAVRPSLGKIEDFSSEIQNKDNGIQSLLISADENSMIIEEGQKTRITKKIQDTYIQDNGLEEVVNAQTLASAQDSIKKLPQDSDKQIKSFKSVKVDEIAPQDLQKHKEQFASLKPIPVEQINEAVENPEELKKILQNHKDQNKEAIQQEIETIYKKSFEKLELTNGKIITGVVSQSGNTYIVVTTDGVFKFPASEVMGIAF